MCDVKGNVIVADSASLTKVLTQWTKDMQDPKAQSKFLYNAREYFATRGINDDQVREIFIQAGAPNFAANYNCGFTCLCTNGCCVTDISIPATILFL